MIMNAPDTEQSILEKKEGRADAWMYCGMVLVLLGVVIETVPAFLGEKGILHHAHKFGGSMVALGLAIEFAAEAAASKYRAKLKELSETALSEIRERAARAEQAAAEATLAAEQERLARVKIEERLADRRLTPEQHQRIVAALGRFRGQQVAVVLYMLSTESKKLSEQIQTALTSAHWQVNVHSHMGGAEQMPGVTVFISDGQPTIPAANALKEALLSEGIATRYSWEDGSFLPPTARLSHGVVGLFVGPKPVGT
ncbi:MAG: hypothetical protein ACRCZI_05855 [Cetobacterium sp.]